MKITKLRKGLIITVVLVVLIIISIIFVYNFSLTGYKNDDSTVNFTVNSGTSKKTIVKELKDASLIRSDFFTMVYLYFHSDTYLQAGTYSLSRNMSVKDIINKISSGDVNYDTVSFTFVEGKNITDLIELISDKFSIPSTKIEEVLKDKKYMKTLVEKYDFLTDDVLNDNIYYALEGYLFPDTYEFLENTSVEDIITRMLDNTKLKLSNIKINNGYSIHEVLTMASIVELEAVSDSDRKSVAQVIYKRLNMGKGLGMDVTTYYAVHKKLGEELTMNDLRTISPYNTSESNYSMAGRLPIGPICNPSLTSIEAVLNPSDTDYIYFYANINTHEVFFANTYEEFIAIQKEVG